MGGSLKVEQQDCDGQEERVQPSPLTAEEWDGPSKTAVQSRLNPLNTPYIYTMQHTLVKKKYTLGYL